MDWTHTLSIIGTVIGTAYYIHRDILADMRIQSARSDKLFELHAEMRADSDRKFYDLLKNNRKENNV